MRKLIIVGIVGTVLLGASMVQAEPVNLIGAGGTIVVSVESLGVTADSRPILLYINDTDQTLFVNIPGFPGSYVVQLQADGVNRRVKREQDPPAGVTVPNRYS